MSTQNIKYCSPVYSTFSTTVIGSNTFVTASLLHCCRCTTVTGINYKVTIRMID
jgi:hypothetical protein